MSFRRSKIPKLIPVISLLILLVLGPIVFSLLQNAKGVEAAWMDDAYAYRQRVDITNSAGSTLSNQRVKITLDTSALITAGKMQSDCDDIRVTDNNGKLLDHWDTSCNTTSTLIYVKTLSLPTSGATLYLYYGNPSASNVEKTLGSTDYPGTSCQMMKDQGSVTTDGPRYIVPGGNDTDKIQVYCNNTDQSGGWTLAIQNNSAITTNPEPVWSDAVNTVNTTGTFGSTLTAFDLILGLKHWNYIGSTSMVQVGTTPSNITKRATYDSISLNSGNNYALSLGTETLYLGATTAGIKSYSAANNYQFTTSDADHDVNGSNCANSYGGSPWWYGSCWNGSFWGRGDGGSQNAPYWSGSTSDYHSYGAIYLGGTDTMKDVSSASPTNEEKSLAPIAYWKFDEGTGTTTNDSTSNSNTGTITGATWKSEDQCISGKCLYYDGSSDYVTNNKAISMGTGNFSVSFWMRMGGTTGNYSLFDEGGPSDSTKPGYQMFISNTSLRYNISNGSGNWEEVVVSNTSGINDNKWHYVTWTYNAAQNQFYVDGILKMQRNWTYGSGSPTANFKIATSWTASPVGFLDDFKIYNYARTAAQIKSDFKSRGTAKGSSASLGSKISDLGSLSNGLVGYWKMDEISGAGSTLADSSGNSNTGTAVLWGGGNTSTDSAHVAGKFGNSFSFDGGDDNVTVTDVASLQAGATMTVSTWFKLNATASDKRFVDKTNNGTGYSLAANSTTPRFITGNGSTYDNLDGTTTLVTGTWYHMVGTVENGTKRIYVNGNLENTASITFNGVGTGVNFRIGARAAAQAVNASIDEIRLYNRALSPREVRDLYAFAPGPVAYWKLDEKTGITANDSSGNNNTGTLTNSPIWGIGKFGSGVTLTTADKYIDVPTLLPNIINNSLTIEGWINVSLGGVQRIFTERSQSYPQIGVTGTTLFVHTKTTSGTDTNLPYTTLPSNCQTGWHHLAVTWDASLPSNNVRAYCDGINFTSATLVNAINGTFSFSGFRIGYNTSTQSVNGSVDDVRIYNYARNSKQIVEDMNAGHPVGGSPVGSQRLYWKLDEGYGTSTRDAGPNNYTGTLTCGGTSCTNPTWSNDGKFGKALYFIGSGTSTRQFVNATSINTGTNTGDKITISAWIRPDSSQAGGGWFIRNGNGYDENYGFSLGSPSGGNYRLTIERYISSFVSTSTTGYYIPVSSWNHITIIYSQGEWFKLYVNGVLKETVALSGLSVQSTSSFNLGGHNGTNNQYLNGFLDEVKIYSGELSEDEIKLDYNRGQAMVLGTLSDTSGLTGGSVASSAASALYCLPGDTATCTPPIAEWSLDEGSGNSVNDVSGNGYIGTWNGSSNHWVDGILGKAGNFSTANGDYVGLGTTASLTPTSLVTAEAWIYPTRFPTQGSERMGIIGRNYRTPWQMSLWESGQVVWGYTMSDGTSFDYKSVGSPLTLNQWNFVAITHNVSTGQLISYINGRQTTYTAIYTGTLVTPSGTATIGSSGGSSQIFQGKIDRPRIFDYVRTPAQVAWDYNQGKPIAQWKMDECQGGSIFDASGNGNTGTITIGATGTQTAVGTCTTSGTAWYNGVTGKFNSSLNFDGTDDYVCTDTNQDTTCDDVDSLDMRTNSWTASAWVKTSAGAGSWRIVSKDNNGTTNSWDLYLTSGACTGRMIAAGPISRIAQSTTLINDGNWHMCSATWSRTGNIQIYIDGKPNGTPLDISDLAASDLNVNNAVNIGRRTVGGYFTGQIDDVRIYNYALTGTQVKNLFNGGAAVKFGPVTGSP